MVSLTTFMKKPPTFKIFLLNMAKLGAARGFYMVYLYTCELYPTDIRTTAVGCSSVCARHDTSFLRLTLVVRSFNPYASIDLGTHCEALLGAHHFLFMCFSAAEAVYMQAGRLSMTQQNRKRCSPNNSLAMTSNVPNLRNYLATGSAPL